MINIILDGKHYSFGVPSKDKAKPKPKNRGDFNSALGSYDITEPTESAEMLRVLNEDLIEKHTRMSGIDMKANMGDYEIQTVLAMDALVGMGVLPSICLALTRSKKRLSRSRMGFGSEQMVRMINGHRDLQTNSGWVDKLKSGIGGAKQ